MKICQHTSTEFCTTVCSIFDKGYRYGQNGQERDYELCKDIYTAEFWEYDSRLGRRWNLDPVVIYSISSYSCFNNNPVFNIDILGDKFEPNSVAKAKEYKTSLDSRKKQIANFITIKNKEIKKAKGDNKKSLENELAELKTAQTEINNAISEYDEMEKSDQVYELKKISGDKGNTSYDPNTKRVVISYTSDNVLAHEFVHAYDFEKGNTAFIGSDYTTKSGHDINDEVNGYKRQYAYEGMGHSANATTCLTNITKFSDITADWVKNTMGYNNPMTTINITINMTMNDFQNALIAAGLKGSNIFSTDVMKEYGTLTVKKYYEKLNTLPANKSANRQYYFR